MTTANENSHPTNEQWAEYLYGEGDIKALELHLDQCPSCSQQIERWRQVMEQLDQWPAPDPAQPIAIAESLSNWAPHETIGWSRSIWMGVAASVLLMLGFAGGMVSAEQHNRSALEAKIRQIVDRSLERKRFTDAQQVEKIVQMATTRVESALNHRRDTVLAQHQIRNSGAMQQLLAEQTKMIAQQTQITSKQMKIQTQIKQVSTVVQDLLHLSRLDDHEPEFESHKNSKNFVTVSYTR